MTNEISVGFTGDICFSGTFRQNLAEKKQIFQNELIEKFKLEDFIICNFEGPATTQTNNLRNDVFVVNPIESIEYLSNYNINVFNLANNHIFDCDINGFHDTLTSLKNKNLKYFGAGNNIFDASSICYIEKNNIKISLIGIAHKEGLIASNTTSGVFCIDDFLVLKNQIIEAKKNSNFVVINYHGGEEFTQFPMPSRRKLIREISKLSPDIIICHHPHVFQGVEKIKNTTVFYSLGNFIFDIPQHNNRNFTDQSAYLSITFNDVDFTYNLTPINIDRNVGQISISSNNFNVDFQKLSNFNNYYIKWLKETERVYNEEIKSRFINTVATNINTKSNKIFGLSFYKKIVFILVNTTRRSIITGAFFMKILRKIKLVK